MESTTLDSPVETCIELKSAKVILMDYGWGQGKIKLSTNYGGTYEYFWGSMGDDLSGFIARINSEYFADKLLGARNTHVFCVKQTFANLRRHIKEEILDWYEHMDFQKDMREKINDFQEWCKEMDSDKAFVSLFNASFVSCLDFYLIEDRYDQKKIESAFESITEPWHFIGEKPSEEYLFLMDIHTKLK